MKIERQKPRDEAIEKIENYMIRNRLQADDKLPSERAMCEMWDFNRSTLRSAIKQLISQGKIYNKSWSGICRMPEGCIRQRRIWAERLQARCWICPSARHPNTSGAR